LAVKGGTTSTTFQQDKTIGKRVYSVLSPVEIGNSQTPWAVATVVSIDEVTESVNKLILLITVVGFLGILVLTVIIWYIGGMIANPIKELSQIIDRLSKYDLSIDKNSKTTKYIKRKDEIGLISNALATMQNNLISLIRGIADISQQVASSSEELTATSQQSATAANEVARTIEEIANGASDQARNTEEGSVHINELGQLIEKDQEYVNNLNITANEVSILKDEGLEGLKDLVEKTNINNKASKDIHEIIINTNESAKKIENASQMIKSIAEQTNLLALNAAIEAARAGETGRGFAVVAEEIRRLSEQSNAFTSEISEVIKELTNKTQYAVETIEEVGKLFVSQAKSVDESNEKFEGIAAAIEKMKIAIANINESGKEMENKKGQIIGIIENLSAISEENAAGTQEASASIEEQTSSMEEISNASESLAKLAEEMQENISKFKY
jgi:methyl-accepting chemotaxis protein